MDLVQEKLNTNVLMAAAGITKLLITIIRKRQTKLVGHIKKIDGVEKAFCGKILDKRGREKQRNMFVESLTARQQRVLQAICTSLKFQIPKRISES